MLKGFDVSAYQGNTVPSCDFVFVKATEGTNYKSSKFAAQWASAKKNADARGAYHFARPEASSGTVQADYFLSVVNPEPGDILCLDLEASKLNQAGTNKFAIDFAKRLAEKAPDNKRVIYMGSGYASNGTGKGLDQYYHYWWYPQYPSTKSTKTWKTSFSPWLPSGLTCGWSKPHIWQWTDNFGGLDANISTLALSDLTSGEAESSSPAPKPTTGGTVSNSAAPSWDAVYALIKQQKARYAQGRHGENSNKYTDWYGMVGPFCFMFVSWVLAHAGPSESAGLALIGGKKAYVPDIRKIKGYHAGHSGVKVGAIAAVNDFNHIGFVTKINRNGTFELYSGNTTYDGSDDAVWPKTYSLSYISGYVNLAYGTGEDDDFMAEYISIDKNDKSRHEVLKDGVWQQLYWNQNNSADSKKHHSNGDYPSVLNGHYYYNGTFNVRISGLPKGAEGQVRCLYTDAKSNAVKAECYISEFVGSEGDTFVTHPAVGYVPTGQKLRLEVAVFDIGDAQPTVVEGQVRLHAREA